MRERDWDVPRQTVLMSSGREAGTFSLPPCLDHLQPRPGAGEGVEQPAFSTCFNSVIILPKVRTQMQRQREVGAGGRVCLG